MDSFKFTEKPLMPAKKLKVDWSKEIKPLIKKYKNRKHPLDYKNEYQLLVIVLLSARSSDAYINKIAPELFNGFPDMNSLVGATEKDLIPFLKGVPGHRNKISWILRIADQLKGKPIPLTMEGLTALPGIGRKTANVIMRETGKKAEGVMVDLHVVRVANRLGIAKSDDPNEIEKQIMEKVDRKDWGEAGMAISFLGRDICRPSHPEHDQCPMTGVCQFYLSGASAKMTKAKAAKKAKKKPAK